MTDIATAYFTIPGWALELLELHPHDRLDVNDDGTATLTVFHIDQELALGPQLERLQIGYDQVWGNDEYSLGGQRWVRFDAGGRQEVEITNELKLELAEGAIDRFLTPAGQGGADPYAIGIAIIHRLQASPVRPVTVDVKDIQPTEAQRRALGQLTREDSP